MSMFASGFAQNRKCCTRAVRVHAGMLIAIAFVVVALVAASSVGASRAYAYDSMNQNYGSYYGAPENADGEASSVEGLVNESESDEASEDDASEPEGIVEKAQLAGSTSVDNSPSNVVDPSQRADNSFIYDTTIASLADEAALSDGQTVQISGEAIGDRIATGTEGFCWITVEAEAPDDSSSISVYMPDKLADQIDEYGRYGVVGSRIQVRGEYHQACKEHDGLSDIHATTVEVTAQGVHNPDKFDINKFIPGAVLIALGVAMVVAFSIVRERMR